MPPHRPLRVAIWCAVSSKPQAAEDKDSLTDQERRGRAWAAMAGENSLAGGVTLRGRLAEARE